MTSEEAKGKVVGFYDKIQPLMSLFWSRDYLRYGLWDSSTKSVREALANTDRLVANCLNLNEGDVVLDAGCGIGGSAVFMARNYGCRVDGINLCKSQLDIARKKVVKSGLSDLVGFQEADYTRTPFSNDYFTKAFAVESVYHAEDPRKFTDEMHRVLMSGGKLVIVDRFLRTQDLNSEQMAQADTYMSGQAVSRLHSVDDILFALKSSGFIDVVYQNRMNEAIKCIKESTKSDKLLVPVCGFLNRIGLFPETILNSGRSFIEIEKLFDSGIMTYGAFVAKK